MLLGVESVGAPVAARHVVGETGREESGFADSVEGPDHVGANVTAQESEHRRAADVESEGGGIAGEFDVEFGGIDVAAFEAGPRVVVWIGGVHPTDRVERNTVLGLEAVEGFERTTEDHPAEVPQNGSVHSGIRTRHMPIVGRAGPDAPMDA